MIKLALKLPMYIFFFINNIKKKNIVYLKNLYHYYIKELIMELCYLNNKLHVFSLMLFYVLFPEGQYLGNIINLFFLFCFWNSQGDYKDLPTIYFNELFSGPCIPKMFEKLKCIIHYFERIIAQGK